LETQTGLLIHPISRVQSILKQICFRSDGKNKHMTGSRKSVSGAVLGLLWLAGCGRSPPAPGIPPDQTSSSLILERSSASVSPKARSVSENGSLTTVNSEGAPYPLTSNAYPRKLSCPELYSPMRAPGDQFMVAMANRNRTCAFIDILILLSRASRARSMMTAGRSPSGDGNGVGGGGY